MYPNPSKGALNFTIKKQFTKGIVDVYDVIGKIVLTESISGTQTHQINLSGNKGIFLFESSIRRQDFHKETYCKIKISDNTHLHSVCK